MPNDEPYIGKLAYQGDIAANYELDRVTEPVWQEEQRWMEAWARELPAGASVLDLPAGTGRFVGILRARGCRVHAVDISEDMLHELRRRHPAGEGLIIERGDAEALPYADASFDYVVCWRLFHLLPPAASERVLRELGRVCRGQIVLDVFGVEDLGVATAVWRRIKTCVRAGWRRLRHDPPASATAVGSTPWAHIKSYAFTERGLRRRFTRCGLRLLRAETLTRYHGTPARIYFLAREPAAP